MALNNDPTLPSPEPGPPRKSARPDPDDLTGQVLSNKYRVIGLLGQGGFGTVYEAVDEMLGASVAVKVLNRQAAEYEDSLNQFLGEARLLTSLDQHPNIVRWITFDRTPNGLHYFVMEFLRGKELSKLLNEKDRLPKEQAIAILLQILSALEAAHFLADGRSLLHLDLKPNNVFVMRGDAMQIKVIDFGISQHVGAAARSAAGIAAPATRKKTDDEPGETMSTIPSMDPPDLEASSRGVQRARGGTPLYASPEQCRHLNLEADIVELDGRSDIYSLGVMAFELLAGRLPWICRSKTEAFKAHLTLPVPSFASVDVRVPRRLERFVQRCLAKDRDKRFPDVRAARAELELIANPKTPWLAYVSAVAVIAAVVLWLVWPDTARQIAELKVSNNEVFLGPSRTSIDIPVGNLLRTTSRETRWVSDQADPKPILADWTVRLVEKDGDTHLHVEAPASPKAIEVGRAYLQFGEGSPAQFSQPVRVAYLLPDGWKIASAEVRGANMRTIIDPIGASLEATVATPDPSLIKTVEVHWGTEHLPASLNPSRSTAQTVVYSLPLTTFAAIAPDQEQTAPLRLLVVDKADNQQTLPCELRLDGRSLSFRPELQCPKILGSALVYPGSRPLMRLGANRKVKLILEANDEQGTRIDARATPDGDDWRLEFPDLATSCSGSLRVTVDDSQGVYHDTPTRGQRSETLTFQFEKEQVVVEVDLRHTDRSPLKALDAATFVTNESELQLALRRKTVQATVEIACNRDGQPAASKTVELHRQPEASAAIPLTEDGVYTLVLRSFRHYGVAKRDLTQEQPETTINLTIVRDTKRPALRLVEGPAKILGQVAADAVWFKAALDEERSTATTLRWQLDGSPSRKDGIEIPPGPAAEEAITWSRLKLKPEELEDGSYTLSLTAVDAAENSTPLEPVTFVVARNGPQLSLKVPPPVWSDNYGDVFTLRIAAKDPNGVAWVECRVELKSTGEKTDWFALKPADENNIRDGDWVAQRTLKSTWSDQDVSIQWRGADREGKETAAQSAPRQVASFEARMKPRILHRAAANADVNHLMRFVRGSGRIPYKFGGRGEQQERADFAKAADIPFDEAPGINCLSRPEDVANYYLDENEVTIAQYLVFLHSPGGYGEVKNWPEASPDAERLKNPEAKRLKKLQEDLGRVVDKQLPVTGLQWAECDAYARWAGKRLPSDVEWEYAARGGESYRLFSCQGKDFKAAEFPADCASPWPVDRGCDVVASGIAEGIRNLCSNVSEWTSTRKDNLDLYYAAGAYFRDKAYNFLIIRPYEPWIPRDDIGFRCAIDAAKVRAALEDGAGSCIITDPPPNLPGK